MVYTKKRRSFKKKRTAYGKGEELKTLTINLPQDWLNPSDGTAIGGRIQSAAATGGFVDMKLLNSDTPNNAAGAGDGFTENIVFGSRCDYVGTGNLLDGSVPIVLHTNRSFLDVDGFTGSKYAIKSVHFKGSLFAALGAETSPPDVMTPGKLWTQETIIEAKLVVEPDPKNYTHAGATTVSHLMGSNLFFGEAVGVKNRNDMDKMVEKFYHVDIRDSFKTLKSEKWELAPASSGSDPYLPIEFHYVFKQPLVVESLLAIANTKQAGVDIKRNRLTLMFYARGCASLTGEVRVRFCDI